MFLNVILFFGKLIICLMKCFFELIIGGLLNMIMLKWLGLEIFLMKILLLFWYVGIIDVFFIFIGVIIKLWIISVIVSVVMIISI